MDTSVRLANAIILAELRSSRLDWWAACTENSNAILETIAGNSSRSQCLQGNRVFIQRNQSDRQKRSSDIHSIQRFFD